MILLSHVFSCLAWVLVTPAQLLQNSRFISFRKPPIQWSSRVWPCSYQAKKCFYDFDKLPINHIYHLHPLGLQFNSSTNMSVFSHKICPSRQLYAAICELFSQFSSVIIRPRCRNRCNMMQPLRGYINLFKLCTGCPRLHLKSPDFVALKKYHRILNCDKELCHHPTHRLTQGIFSLVGFSQVPAGFISIQNWHWIPTPQGCLSAASWVGGCGIQRISWALPAPMALEPKWQQGGPTIHHQTAKLVTQKNLTSSIVSTRQGAVPPPNPQTHARHLFAGWIQPGPCWLHINPKLTLNPNTTRLPFSCLSAPAQPCTWGIGCLLPRRWR